MPVKDVSYLCLIVYTIAIYVRPAEVWIEFPFVEALAALSAVVVGVSYLARPRPFWDLPHDKLILGLWAAVVISNLSWGWFGGAWLGFVAFLKVVFYYFLIRFAVREQWQLQGFVLTVIAVNVVLAVNGIVQHHWGIGLGGALSPDGRIRGTGIFNDPNDLALSFVMVVALLLGVPTHVARGWARRVVLLGCLAVLVLATLYTNSRSGMLGLGVVVTGWVFWRVGVLGGVVGGALLVAAVLAWGPSRISMPAMPERASTSLRVYAWGAGLRMFKEDPLFGVGYDRFLEFHEVVAHNSFIHVVAELGVLGAFFWVGLHYWFLKGVLPHPRAGAAPGIDRWRPSLLLSFAGTLTICWFLSRQYVLYPYTLLGMGACYASIAKAEGASIDLKISAASVVHVLLLIVAGVSGTYLAVRLLILMSAG